MLRHTAVAHEFQQQLMHLLCGAHVDADDARGHQFTPAVESVGDLTRRR